MPQPPDQAVITPGLPPPPKTRPWRIVPEPESPLAELVAQRKAALAMAADMVSRADALTARIKGEVASATDGYPVVDIAQEPGEPDLRLAYRPGRKMIDAKRLKTERPEIHAAYLTQGKGYWELRELGS